MKCVYHFQNSPRQVHPHSFFTIFPHLLSRYDSDKAAEEVGSSDPPMAPQQGVKVSSDLSDKGMESEILMAVYLQ